MKYSKPLRSDQDSSSDISAWETAPVPSVTSPSSHVSDLETVPVPSVTGSSINGGVPAHSRREPLSRQIVVVAALMWLATRIGYLAVTYFPAHHLGAAGQASSRNQLDLWRQLDANWYIHIAQHGYDSLASTAFFPLYPLLTRGLIFVLGESHSLLAAMVISNLGSLVAFIGLGLLAAHDAQNDSAAPRAIRMLAAYPFAFFLFAPYTEGIFLGFAVMSLLCARRGSWKWAALWAFLAGATRPTGIILIPALLWEFGRQHGWWRRAYWHAGRWRELPSALLRVKPVSDFIVALGAVPLALGLFALYCNGRFGQPLAPFTAQQRYWGRTNLPVWQTLARLVSNLLAAPIGSGVEALILIDFGAVALCAAVTIVTIRKAPLAYTIYMAGLIYLSFATPILRSPSIIDSAARFMLVAFPVWLVLGRWTEKRPWLDMFVISVGFTLQTVFALLFMSGFGIQ